MVVGISSFKLRKKEEMVLGGVPRMGRGMMVIPKGVLVPHLLFTKSKYIYEKQSQDDRITFHRATVMQFTGVLDGS